MVQGRQEWVDWEEYVLNIAALGVNNKLCHICRLGMNEKKAPDLQMNNKFVDQGNNNLPTTNLAIFVNEVGMTICRLENNKSCHICKWRWKGNNKPGYICK